MKTLKKLIILFLFVIMIGCSKAPTPLEYYNEIKNNFGSDCIIRKEERYQYLVKDSDCNIWKITVNFEIINGEAKAYIYSKELIF